jgi:hypothetical protein
MLQRIFIWGTTFSRPELWKKPLSLWFSLLWEHFWSCEKSENQEHLSLHKYQENDKYKYNKGKINSFKNLGEWLVRDTIFQYNFK